MNCAFNYLVDTHKILTGILAEEARLGLLGRVAYQRKVQLLTAIDALETALLLEWNYRIVKVPT